MERVRQGAQVKPKIPGIVPCTLVEIVLYDLLAQQNPRSVVGAYLFPDSVVGAINSHTVRLPHMPLGINNVVGARIYHTE